MALERETIIDRIEVLETGHIQVRRAEWLVENGRRVSLIRYLRVAYEPDRDLSHEDKRVQAVAAAIRGTAPAKKSG